MHPFTEGAIAAARKEIWKCLEEMRRAIHAPGMTGWEHIGVAHAHAASAHARLDDALRVEQMATEGEVQ